jgi:hypothetical protein
MHMKKIHPALFPSVSWECSPFKDLMDTPIERNTNTMREDGEEPRRGQLSKSHPIVKE